jgi:hypothetical protein
VGRSEQNWELSLNRFKLGWAFWDFRFSAIRRKSGGAPPQSKTLRAYVPAPVFLSSNNMAATARTE